MKNYSLNNWRKNSPDNPYFMKYVFFHSDLISKSPSIDYLALIIIIGMCILIMLVNPILVIILGALLEAKVPFGKVVNYLIALSMTLSISNRTIGPGWYSRNGDKANDDAVNYLGWYRDTEFNSYIGNVSQYWDKLLSGQEPLWFFIVETTGFISNYSEHALVFVSVAVPVFLLHYSFQRVSPYFFTTALLFYVLIPEIFHSFYHLWRFSLSASITYCVFAICLVNGNIHPIRLVLPVLAHSAGLLSGLLFIVANLNLYFDPKNGILSRLGYIFIVLVVVVFAVLLGFSFLDMIGYTKIKWYATLTDFGTFSYSLRHLLYASIATFLLMTSHNRLIILFSIANLLLLALPIAFGSLGIMLDRVLIIVTPVLPLALSFLLREKMVYRTILVLPTSLLYFSFADKVDGTLFYQFMANGEFFNPLSGIFYNLYAREYL